MQSRHRRSRAFTFRSATVLVGVLVVAACSGSDDDTLPVVPGGTTATVPEPTAPSTVSSVDDEPTVTDGDSLDDADATTTTTTGGTYDVDQQYDVFDDHVDGAGEGSASAGRPRSVGALR